ncbi:MAG: hypothetical protein IT445_18795 [Phycisphaeraceae bacterium]|nr:hypothetical protein [Phycisphaeraceae bacterium]
MTSNKSRLMKPKERVLAAFAHSEPDRVPINYINYERHASKVHRELKAHYGIPVEVTVESELALMDALGVDFRTVGPNYIGPNLYESPPDSDVKTDNWGIQKRWIQNEAGGYWEYTSFPLRDADESAIAVWKMPDPDDFDYDVILEKCKRVADYAVFIGGPHIADIINTNGMLRSMEQVMMDLALDEPAGRLLTQRRVKIQLAILDRALDKAQGMIDFLWMGEDLGTQHAPLISLDMYRATLKPFHQQYIDLAASYDIPVMVHSCGSCSWVYDELIDMGITAVDAVQPEARNMEPARLKRAFGDRLSFHGCISTAGPLAYGTADDVERVCRDTLDVMKPSGGYCFAPTHSIQDNSPLDNVIRMYEVGREYGRY